ncbi:HNH endonuclease [Rufibacter sediminis]
MNGRKVYLHRFIMGAPEDLEVDHKNHQTLDCRRENLECITPEVNKQRKRQRRKMKV